MGLGKAAIKWMNVGNDQKLWTRITQKTTPGEWEIWRWVGTIGAENI
jgi:hypothetical protein